MSSVIRKRLLVRKIIGLALLAMLALTLSACGPSEVQLEATQAAELAAQSEALRQTQTVEVASWTATPSVTSMPTETSTSIPTQTSTPTVTPTPTELPGKVVVPIDQMAASIPWLPLDSANAPTTYFYAFNVSKPPFDDPLVRQAFSMTVNREGLIYNIGGLKKPATSVTPPEVLGRDLYDQVGLNFDIQKAQEKLAEAGYPDGEGFPRTVLFMNDSYGHTVIAREIVAYWKTYLKVDVYLETVSWEKYLDMLNTDPPAIYRLGWVADYNDPENFLMLFHSKSDDNRSSYENSRYDALLDQAADYEHLTPLERQALFIEADRIVSEEDAVVIPIYNDLMNLN